MTVKNSNNPPDTLTSTFVGPGADSTYPEYYAFRWAHDMWKTALGVSPSAFNAGQILAYKKNTHASTTSGSANMTTTTAGFFAADDVGRLVHGNGLPTRTFIKPTTTIAAASNGVALPTATINVAATAWAAASGSIRVLTSTGSQTVNYTAKTATSFTGCTLGTGTMSTGNPVINGAGTAVVLSQNATANADSNLKIEFEGVNTITDPREGKSVDLITVDFDVFKSWDGGTAGNYFHAAPNYAYAGPPLPDQRRAQTSSFGGSSNCYNVYVTVAQVAGKERAVRFKNCAACMRNNPDPGNPAVAPYDGIISTWPEIYYVSDVPLYIQGDFNSRAWDPSDARGPGGTQPPCNTLNANNSASRPQVWEASNANLQWDQDSSVLIADSVTLLSNAWDDANSASALASRIASSTTVNTRIITGDVPTNATNGYSGGGENLIRLLEDWTGKYLTFSGTLMQLFHSKIGTGTWGKANVYVEPKPVSNIGGRFFYQETAYTYAKPWGIEYFVGYAKHEWSPTP